MSRATVSTVAGGVALRSAATERLPSWMRGALLATAAMNAGAGIAFLPPAEGLRALTGFPDGEPLYLATVALFVLLFGAGYLWIGLTGRPERLFIALSAAGKLGFVALVTAFWASGTLPLRALVSALGDLPFGVLFGWWVWTARRTPG
jgi:hypothetical protein